MNDAVQTELVKSFDDIRNALDKMAPQAIELALSVKRVEGLTNAAIFVLCLLISLFSARYGIRAYKKDVVAEHLYMLPAIISILFGVFAVMTGGDVWAWISIFRPDLSLAHDVIRSLTP